MITKKTKVELHRIYKEYEEVLSMVVLGRPGGFTQKGEINEILEVNDEKITLLYICDLQRRIDFYNNIKEV